MGEVRRRAVRCGARIFKRGFEEAVRLLQGSGTAVWASSLPQWLKDPDFIFFLAGDGGGLARAFQRICAEQSAGQRTASSQG